MISKKNYKAWIDNDHDNSLSMIAVGYDPASKYDLIKLGGFDLENNISDKIYFSSLISKISKTFIGRDFLARVQFPRNGWLNSDVIADSSNYELIKNYLNKFNWEKKYYGHIEVTNLEEFLITFIDFPIKYYGQDFELYSLDSDFLLVISNHGTLWIISKLEEQLYEIGKLLEADGATVFPRKYIR